MAMRMRTKEPWATGDNLIQTNLNSDVISSSIACVEKLESIVIIYSRSTITFSVAIFTFEKDAQCK